MKDNLGTPKSLNIAIRRAMLLADDNTRNAHAERTYWAVKDFMAQKFCIYYYKARNNPEATELLQELYQILTKDV